MPALHHSLGHWLCQSLLGNYNLTKSDVVPPPNRCLKLNLIRLGKLASEILHCIRKCGWMDELGVYVHFNSISVISRRWKGETERLCAMKCRLGSRRISPPAGFEPATPLSEVWSANRSATRTLLESVDHASRELCLFYAHIRLRRANKNGILNKILNILYSFERLWVAGFSKKQWNEKKRQRHGSNFTSC